MVTWEAYWPIGLLEDPQMLYLQIFSGGLGGHFSKKESSCYRSYAWPANTTKPSGFGDCSGGFDFHRALVYTTGMSSSYSSILLKTDYIRLEISVTYSRDLLISFIFCDLTLLSALKSLYPICSSLHVPLFWERTSIKHLRSSCILNQHSPFASELKTLFMMQQFQLCQNILLLNTVLEIKFSKMIDFRFFILLLDFAIQPHENEAQFCQVLGR